MGKRIEYTPGQLVNGVVFVEETARGKRERRAKFVCGFCGEVFECQINNIVTGNTTSCGCLSRAGNSKNGIHMLSSHPIYYKWAAMVSRCENPKNNSYINYGGRGISVYKPWIKNVRLFYDYVTSLPNYDDNNLGYQGVTLDRINNDGNYEPGNVRWADYHTQLANRRSSRNTSGYVGVSLYGDKWKPRICVLGKSTWLGTYITKRDAVEARNNYIIEHELWEYPIQEWVGDRIAGGINKKV